MREKIEVTCGPWTKGSRSEDLVVNVSPIRKTADGEWPWLLWTDTVADCPFPPPIMVAAKSVPQNHLVDPFEAVLRPPPGETSAQRDARILAEQLAKRVSDSIDEQLRAERAELKKNRPDVRILLLGQSESGKSTTLKRTCTLIPLLHLPTRSWARISI